jgi:hypothetical protein
MSGGATFEDVAALRESLWDAGYRPVPVYGPDAPGLSPGKRPCGKAWQHMARRDPPAAATDAPRAEALNTGILCDGLRGIDLDIDDSASAHRCRSIAIGMFGEAPVRTRLDSPRALILYRAAEGAPAKRQLRGDLGSIEILGLGQQFVAFGRHPAGASLDWFPDPPGQELASGLPAVTEAGLAVFLTACRPVIGAYEIAPEVIDRIRPDQAA